MMSEYISDEKINKIFDSLDLGLEDVSLEDREDFVKEAEADLHRGVSERFVVPLRHESGPFSSAPDFTKRSVESAMKALIRKCVADEHFKSSDENQTVSFRDLYYKKSGKYIKDLMNTNIVYHLKLSPSASEFRPVQIIGIARSRD